MSTGNPLVDALDALIAKVDTLTQAVKSADPKAVLNAACAGARDGAGREARESARQVQDAAQKALEAATEAREAAAHQTLTLRLWTLLAAVLGGVAIGVIMTALWLAPVSRVEATGREWVDADGRISDAVRTLADKVGQIAEHACSPAASPPKPKRHEG